MSTILKFITIFLFVTQPLLFYLIVTFEDFLLFLSLKNLDQNTPPYKKNFLYTTILGAKVSNNNIYSQDYTINWNLTSNKDNNHGNLYDILNKHHLK